MDYFRLIKGKASKNLKHSVLYRDLTEIGADCPDWLRDCPMQQGDLLLGVYENDGRRADGNVVLTALGIYLLMQDSTWQHIAYRKMQAIGHPPVEFASDKTTIDHLDVHTDGGQHFTISVSGGRGRTRDAWVLLHFLDVAKDLSLKYLPKE